MLGVTGMNARGQVTVNTDLRQSQEAVKAREEIDSSADAVLVGSAGQSLIQLLNSIRFEPRRFLPFVPSPPEPEDLSPVAELWLTRARELAPGNTAWNDGLVQVYQRRAGQIQDPRGKVKFLSEADTVANDNQRANLLPNLAMAEFEAGDDAAAARDAQRLLDLATKSPANRENMIHAGNTILGRVALAKKDVNEARQRMLASARVAGSPVLNSFGPRMELAQDLLDAGQRDAVLQYLEMCRAFWIYDQGQLDHKIKLVKSPGNPDLIQRWTSPGMQLVGKKAPPFALKDLSGMEWNLDQLAGKTIALEFFTTSCKSCGEELAMLANRQEVVTLAVNVGESEGALREFAGQNHLTMPILIGGKDSAILRYDVDTYPTLAMIDRSGLVALYRAGRGANVKADLERGAAGVPVKTIPSTPVQLTPADGAVFAGVPRKLTLNWEPVEGADSYVVEWDYRDAKGWVSEHNGGLTPVIPTREPSAILDFIGARLGRWRVYAVSSAGDAGKTSAWREFECKR
jgi:peroxiredoxin